MDHSINKHIVDQAAYAYLAKTPPFLRTSHGLPISAAEGEPILTRFGDIVDVRRRGALRIGKFAGTQARPVEAPAVIRLWEDGQCREMSAHQARVLAAQLLAAASFADAQNSH